MRRSFLSLASVAAVLSAGSPALAYCRTTTEPTPAGYDPTTKGCITGGVPLAWPSMPVTYQLNEGASSQVSLADATSIFDQAFAKWAAATCAADMSKHAGVSFQDLGPTTADYTPCDGGTACEMAARSSPHVIVFRDQSWPYNDPANTLALTTVTFGLDTGNIYAADMEINTLEHMVSTSTPPPAGAFSLEAIATHEAGHFIGIAHSQVDTAIMFARYQADAIKLTQDDVDAVCSIYPPPTPPSSSGCSLGPGARAAGAGWIAGLVAAAGFARRRRVARRAGRCKDANLCAPNR